MNSRKGPRLGDQARSGRWGEVGRGCAGLGSARQRAPAASGSGGSMQGRAPSRAWCCRARAGEGSPELQGQGTGGRCGPLLAWAEQEGGQGIRPLTAACQDLHGTHGASRARLCPVATSPACPPPATLRALPAAEVTPSQPLHGTLPPASLRPSPAPSLLLSDACQDLPMRASQRSC